MAKSENDTNAAPNALKEIEFFPEAAVLKELKALPGEKRNQFLTDLELLKKGLDPINKVAHLTALGNGVIELKINGRPAYRCIYYTKHEGKIVVLHATEKTTNGSDRQIANVVAERLKALEARLQQDKREAKKR